jgi:hypothetical protein
VPIPKNKNDESLLLILHLVHSEFVNEEFVNSFIHNSLTSDHCFETIYEQPFTRGVGITFFHRKRSIVSTFMPISRQLIRALSGRYPIRIDSKVLIFGTSFRMGTCSISIIFFFIFFSIYDLLIYDHLLLPSSTQYVLLRST